MACLQSAKRVKKKDYIIHVSSYSCHVQVYSNHAIKRRFFPWQYNNGVVIRPQAYSRLRCVRVRAEMGDEDATGGL